MVAVSFSDLHTRSCRIEQAPAFSAQRVHRGKRQRQPSKSRRCGSQHITRIMSTQVHPAKADQQNQDERTEHCSYSPTPGFECDDRKDSQQAIQQRCRHGVAARETITVE